MPLGRGSSNDIGSTDTLVSTITRRRLHLRDASLPQPGQSHGRAGVAGSQQRPMRVGIVSSPPPAREEIQTILNGHITRTRLVPRRRGWSDSRTNGIADRQVAQAERDVEGRFIDTRGRVHLGDDMLTDGIGRIERGRVGTIRGDTHERHLPGVGTPGRLADAGPQIDSGRVSTTGDTGDIELTFPKQRARRHHSPHADLTLSHQAGRADGMIELNIEL